MEKFIIEQRNKIVELYYLEEEDDNEIQSLAVSNHN